MKNTLLLLFMAVILFSTSGCLVGLALAIRWDQKRARMMDEQKKKEEGERGTSGTSAEPVSAP